MLVQCFETQGIGALEIFVYYHYYYYYYYYSLKEQIAAVYMLLSCSSSADCTDSLLKDQLMNQKYSQRSDRHTQQLYHHKIDDEEDGGEGVGWGWRCVVAAAFAVVDAYTAREC